MNRFLSPGGCQWTALCPVFAVVQPHLSGPSRFPLFKMLSTVSEDRAIPCTIASFSLFFALAGLVEFGLQKSQNRNESIPYSPVFIMK